jgi:uncharacterized protein
MSWSETVWGGHYCPSLLKLPLSFQETATSNSQAKSGGQSVRPTLASPVQFGGEPLERSRDSRFGCAGGEGHNHSGLLSPLIERADQRLQSEEQPRTGDDLDEDAVRRGLDGLHAQNLAGPAGGADSRVAKYEHRLQEVFNFNRAETAILCTLLLRGPQTPGELRGRTERMHRFEALDEVQSTLQRLMQREPPIVKVLLRQPGTKEARYLHLLSGGVEEIGMAKAPSSASASHSDENSALMRLESEVQELRKELADLKQQVESFRKVLE